MLKQKKNYYCRIYTGGLGEISTGKINCKYTCLMFLQGRSIQQHDALLYLLLCCLNASHRLAFPFASLVR
jgi:hypothetical protein